MALDTDGLAEAIYRSGKSDRFPSIADLTMSQLKHHDPKNLKQYAEKLGIRVQDYISGQREDTYADPVLAPVLVKEHTVASLPDFSTKRLLPAPVVFISAS